MRAAAKARRIGRCSSTCLEGASTTRQKRQSYAHSRSHRGCRRQRRAVTETTHGRMLRIAKRERGRCKDNAPKSEEPSLCPTVTAPHAARRGSVGGLGSSQQDHPPSFYLVRSPGRPCSPSLSTPPHQHHGKFKSQSADSSGPMSGGLICQCCVKSPLLCSGTQCIIAISFILTLVDLNLVSMMLLRAQVPKILGFNGKYTLTPSSINGR